MVPIVLPEWPISATLLAQFSHRVNRIGKGYRVKILKAGPDIEPYGMGNDS